MTALDTNPAKPLKQIMVKNTRNKKAGSLQVLMTALDTNPENY